MDAGYRYATFRFSDGFQMPVYVTAHYHRDQYPGWQQHVEQALKREKPLPVRVTEALRIEPD